MTVATILQRAHQPPIAKSSGGGTPAGLVHRARTISLIATPLFLGPRHD
jgi:hypothetical protein